MSMPKGFKSENGYGTSKLFDGMTYHEIADNMRESGFKMNHSTARNVFVNALIKVADEIAELYKIAYNLYKDESYEEARCFVDTMWPDLKDSNLIPKFALLRAYAIGKYNAKALYIAELEKVAVDYPRTEQSEKALELIKRLNK